MIETILLQAVQTSAPEQLLPTNIWSIGGALSLFAGVIAYLFRLYDSSQERRFTESKESFEKQITQLRGEVAAEKIDAKDLRNRFDTFTQNDHQQMVAAIQRNNELLAKLPR